VAVSTTFTRRDTTALSAICLSALIFGLEISSVPVALPVIGDRFAADLAQLQWVMNAYTIGVAAVLMPAGVLADRFGRKRLLWLAVAAFGAASLLCGLAPSALTLIGFRFAQGLSGGVMLICQPANLSQQFHDGPRRARAFGAWGVAFGMGLGFGPTIGASLVEIASWRWVFLAPAIIAVITVGLVLAGLGESRDPQPATLDLAGLAALTLGVLGLVYFITRGASQGFTSPAQLVIVTLAAACFGAFVIVEHVSAHAMLDFSVFANGRFSGALLGSVGMNVSFWPLMIYLPIYLQRGLGYTIGTASAVMLAYTVPTVLTPPLGERIALRFGAGVVIPAGLYGIGAGLLLMHLGARVPDPSWLTIVPGALLAAVSLGLANTLVTNTTTGSVPAARAGMASGIDMSARMVTLAINIAVMGMLLSLGVTDRTPTMPTDATVHAALSSGFGLVTLYGAVAVSLAATASWACFGKAQH
jgi:MFS family permease